MNCRDCGKTLSYSGGCMGEWEHLNGSRSCEVTTQNTPELKSVEEPFRFQYHTNIGGRNYRTVIELLKKVLKDNYLNIEVTEVPYDKIEKLTAKVKRYEEALGFYADPDNYGSDDVSRSTGNKQFDIICFDFDRDYNTGEDYGGKRARAALAKYRKGMK